MKVIYAGRRSMQTDFIRAAAIGKPMALAVCEALHTRLAGDRRKSVRSTGANAMITIGQKRVFRRSLVAAVLLSAGINTGTAGENVFLSACAERDLRIVMLLEHTEGTNDVAPDKLARVFFTVMAARNACAEGRIAEAIVLYDGVTLGMVLAAMPPL
jgi:hypothetical protein